MTQYTATHIVNVSGDAYSAGNTPTNLTVNGPAEPAPGSISDNGDGIWARGEMVEETPSGPLGNRIFFDGGTTPNGGNFVGVVNVSGQVYPVFYDDFSTFYKAVFDNETAAQAFAAPGIGTPVTIVGTNSFISCFAPGAQIAVPGGVRAVETLAEGDLVRCADGRAVPVRWLGYQDIYPAFETKKRPVRIRAGALGGGVPLSDLIVTAEHGMIMGGVIVDAGALVGHRGVDWAPLSALPQRLRVYHIETQAHEILLANGAPAESFLDIRDRGAFDNAAAYYARYAAERIIAPMALPRVSARRHLPAANPAAKTA